MAIVPPNKRRKIRELLPDTNAKFIYNDSGPLVEIQYPLGYDHDLNADIDIHHLDPALEYIDPTSEPFQEALREAKLL